MSPTRIAIIGGGLAGLTAALRLHQKGYDVQVYEARERVGGRVFTALIKNASGGYSTAEIGGQDISDGGKSHHLLQLLQELGLNIQTQVVPDLYTICSGDEYLDQQNLLARQGLTDEQIMQAAVGCRSMAELLDKLFANNPLLKMTFTTRLTGYEGLSIQNQSVYHNIESLRAMISERRHEWSKGNDWIHSSIHEGNAQLPLRMAEILSDRIHLRKVLTKVSAENQTIKLLFEDGSVSYCDKLVIAIPAPVYSSIEIEQSIVPQKQLQAIQNVLYGANQKVLVPTGRAHADGYDGSMVTDKLVSFFNLTNDVMVMYFINADVLSYFDEQLNIMQQGYGDVGEGKQTLVQAADKQLMQYDAAVTHDWLADPYAKGSFSGYNTVLSDKLDITISYKGVTLKEIFQPVDDRVFFIGEHATILPEVGTMEAAVESGERIALLF